MRVHEAQKGESHMKQTAILTTASLLNILLMTFHLAGDIVFQDGPGRSLKSVCGVHLRSLAVWNAAGLSEPGFRRH